MPQIIERIKKSLEGTIYYNLARRIWRRIKTVKLYLKLPRDYIYDCRRFAKWSHGTGNDFTQKQLESALLKAYHGIEKGLSLSEPRPGFGKDKLDNIMLLADHMNKTFGQSTATNAAVSSLSEYKEFNRQNNVKLENLDQWLKGFDVDVNMGGTEKLERSAILSATQAVSEDFFLTRHSIRDFGEGTVSFDEVRRAVQIACKTPSVCNRQGARIHYFENASDALIWQPGNRGFGHKASCALIVTADIQAFSGCGERNQCWIDGGMFAMSILYALHHLGYGACPLAWTQSARYDRDMRKALRIPDHEAVIMMIAVGTLPESFRVARAARLPIENILFRK